MRRTGNASLTSYTKVLNVSNSIIMCITADPESSWKQQLLHIVVDKAATTPLLHCQRMNSARNRECTSGAPPLHRDLRRPATDRKKMSTESSMF